MRRASTPLRPVLCSLRLSLQVQDAIDVIPTGGILEYASPVQRSMTKSGGISGTKLLGTYAKQDDIYEPGEQNTYRLPPIPTQKGTTPSGAVPFVMRCNYFSCAAICSFNSLFSSSRAEIFWSISARRRRISSSDPAARTGAFSFGPAPMRKVAPILPMVFL